MKVKVTCSPQVAVKVLHKLVGHRGTLIQLQYHQEVEALRRVSHAHVVSLVDVIQSPRRYYVVLELVHGMLLSNLVKHR